MVYASGGNKKDARNDLHTNFNLSAAGASIYLFGADGLLMDKLQTGAFLNDMSYGLDADGMYACFETATLGAANGRGQKGVTGMVQFLTTPGIYDGEIARVDFTLDGRGYTYEAAKLDGNFSRADGEAVGSTALNAEYGATLDRVSLDTWRAHWNRDDVSYYLTNFDGAEESAITEIADTLMKSN